MDINVCYPLTLCIRPTALESSSRVLRMSHLPCSYVVFLLSRWIGNIPLSLISCHLQAMRTLDSYQNYFIYEQLVYLGFPINSILAVCLCLHITTEASCLGCLAFGSPECAADGSRLQQLLLDEQQCFWKVLVCSIGKCREGLGGPRKPHGSEVHLSMFGFLCWEVWRDLGC